MHRAAFVLAGLAAVAAAGCGADRAAVSPERVATEPSRCPREVLVRQSTFAPVSVMLHAAQRNLARQTLSSQGTVYRLTPRHAPIDLVAFAGWAKEGRRNVNFNRLIPGELAIYRMGTAECGAKTTSASWAIHYGMPESVIANTGVYAFFVKTRRGWRFWGDWCGAGQSRAWRRAWCIY